MREIRVNPFSIASSILLFTAPFASWATLSSFGFIVPATLWDISSNQTVFQVSAMVAQTALVTGALLVVAALLSLRWTRPGLAFSVLALSLFSLESYSMYGTFGEGILATILPGAGFLITLSGVLFGIVSLKMRPVPVPVLFSKLRTPRTFAGAGVTLSALTLGLDAWDHWSEGHFSAILGTGGTETAIHGVFLLGITAIFATLLLSKSMFWGRVGYGLTLIAFTGLVLDGVYHAATGSIVDVVGSNSTEIFLHALTYYGVASAVLARMFPELTGTTSQNVPVEKAREIVIST